MHLIKFFHGLGDVLMFRNILKLLNGDVKLWLNPKLAQKPIFAYDKRVQVVRGESYSIQNQRFKEIRFEMQFSKPCLSGNATKVRICLEHEFNILVPEVKIKPVPLQMVFRDQGIISRTKDFLHDLGPYFACHFQGTSSPETQNPSFDFSRLIVKRILHLGYSVIMVNYNYTFHNAKNHDFPFIDGKRIKSTFNNLSLNVESLGWILNNCAGFIGVDSGPLHLALAMDIPAVFVHVNTDFLTAFYDSGLSKLHVLENDSNSDLVDAALNAALWASRSGEL